MTEKMKNEIIPGFTPEQYRNGAYVFKSTDGEATCADNCCVLQLDDNTTICIPKGQIGKAYTGYNYNHPKKDAYGNSINSFVQCLRSHTGSHSLALDGLVRI